MCELTNEQIEKAAIRLFNVNLPRRHRTKLLVWGALRNHEREYYRWAIRSILDATLDRKIVERQINIRHGYSLKGRETPEYRCWVSIKSRCSNQNATRYEDYGGRGITVCAEWRDSFPAFLAYVGLRPSPKHSIDRHPNNDGNYEPGNVRWATKRQQGANRRTTRWVRHGDDLIPLAEACRILGLNHNAVWMRISRGASPEDAIALAAQNRRAPCG